MHGVNEGTKLIARLRGGGGDAAVGSHDEADAEADADAEEEEEDLSQLDREKVVECVVHLK